MQAGRTFLLVGTFGILTVIATIAFWGTRPGMWDSTKRIPELRTHEYAFNIPRSEISEALLKFSEATEIQYFYGPTSENNETEKRTIVGPVVGRYTAEQALDLLAGSDQGVSIQWIQSDFVDIRIDRIKN